MSSVDWAAEETTLYGDFSLADSKRGAGVPEGEFGWTLGSAPMPAFGTAEVDDRRSSFALSRRDSRLSGIVTGMFRACNACL